MGSQSRGGGVMGKAKPVVRHKKSRGKFQEDKAARAGMGRRILFLLSCHFSGLCGLGKPGQASVSACAKWKWEEQPPSSACDHSCRIKEMPFLGEEPKSFWWSHSCWPCPDSFFLPLPPPFRSSSSPSSLFPQLSCFPLVIEILKE